MPKGLRFRAFTLAFQGKQKNISIRSHVYYTKDLSIVGQKSDLPKPKNGNAVQRYPADQEMIRAVLFDASVGAEPEGVFAWRITAEFMPVEAPQPGSAAYWRNLIDRNTTHPIVLDTPGHIGAKVSLLEDRQGALWAAYDTHVNQDEHGKDSDLWMFHSQDKQHWQGPIPIAAVNSTANDFSPVLFQDGRNRYGLVFVSDRRGASELWLALSLDGTRWQRPRRLHIVSQDGKELDGVASPKLFQDSRGLYRLGFYHRESGHILLTTSRDLAYWQPPAALPVEIKANRNEDVNFDYLEDHTGIYRIIASSTFPHDAPMYLGSSKDAKQWDVQAAPFEGNTHPAVIQDDQGRFVLVFSNNGKGLYYIHQASSPDWRHWSTIEMLPRIHYYVDTHMSPADLLQDRDGFYWVAVHKHYGHKFQLFRLPRFPVTTIRDTYIARPDVVRLARYQLRREEAILKAFRGNDSALGRCLSRAMRFESCLRNKR